MLSYRLNPQLRRRPGSLLFWRSVCSGGFSVVVIVNDIRYAINDNFPTAECLSNVTGGLGAKNATFCAIYI
eukprot:COSAG06_NODE_31958_length_513_cov_1.270531_1_plen_71_part_00